MKHLKPAWVTVAILVPFLALPSAAPAANFDQGHYEGVSPLLLTPMRALPADLPAQTSVLRMFHTRLETYLSKNAAYAQMTAILRDPRMEGISAEVRERLRGRGADLSAARSAMMPEAINLDAEDTALAAQRDQLNANKKLLDERYSDIKQQIAQHNASCLPTHPPERHAWCVDNATRLNGVIARYNADVATHNKAVEKWKSDVASLQARWDPFVQRILGWESDVKILVEDARKILDDPCEAMPAVTLDPANPPALETGEKTQEFLAIVSFGFVPAACSVDYSWSVTGKIGRLLPDGADPRRAVLTTGDEEDDGAVKVEVTERKNGRKVAAAASVRVRNREGNTSVTFEAQGTEPPVQKSERYNENRPMCKTEGLQKLDALWARLTASERAERDEAIERAREWIKNRPPEGVPAPPPVLQHFYNRNRRDRDARIDITVWTGKAFVSCDALSPLQIR